MIGKKVMEALRKNIGKKVIVEQVHYGMPHTDKGKLKNVEDFKGIEITDAIIPFIGYGCAVCRIMTEKGEILYENPIIASDYDVRGDILEIERLKELSFGKKFAKTVLSEIFQRHEELKRKVMAAKEQPELKGFVKEAQRIIDENPIEEIDKEFTRRELKLIEKEKKRKGSDFISIMWAKQVIRRAHYMYKVIADETPQRCEETVDELRELFRKADNYNFVLSKPLKEFSKKSRIILEIHCAAGTTTGGAQAIGWAFVELLKERKGCKFPKRKED